MKMETASVRMMNRGRIFLAEVGVTTPEGSILEFEAAFFIGFSAQSG
jgi:hypothetical protein